METKSIDLAFPDPGLEELLPQVYLLTAPRPALRAMLGAAAARLALDATVRVLDGGNLYDAHATARRVWRELHARPDLTRPLQAAEAALDRIQVARAFTCFQMEALLAHQIAGPGPVLILDLLSTFADENVSQGQRSRLLEQILGHLERLARPAPVLVGAVPAGGPPLDAYLRRLEARAQRALWYETPRRPGQLTLF